MSSGNNFTYAKPIVLGPAAEHTSTVIMLHGLGDSGHGWADIGMMFAPELPNVKFVFPHAPRRPITLNGGFVMPGWYDIASLDGINRKEDEEGLRESQRYVEGLVQAELEAGVAAEKILVAGFSQGGAVALLMLRSELKLGGVIGLSTYLPLRNETPVVSAANKQTPVLMGHGDSDQVVSFDFGKQSYEQLQQEGCTVDMKVYPGMGHSACPQELEEIKRFIKARLAA